MTPDCPQCHSSQVVTRDYARKTGGTIGAIAGAASGFSAALKGAHIGGTLGGRLGLLAGPRSAVLGCVAGAILGGLLGGTTGCSAGAALGELIDAKVLRNRRCLECGLTFGQDTVVYGMRRPPSFDEADATGFGHHPFGRTEDDEPFSSARS